MTIKQYGQFIGLLVCIAALFGGAACSRPTQESGDRVRQVRVETRTISEKIDLVANIESASVSAARVETGGRLRRFLVKLNEFVQEGDAVAVVENSDVERAYQEAEQRVAIAEANVRKREAEVKLKTTEGDVAVATAERDVARAELAIAKLRYDAQKSMFEKCTVTAPFEGRVISIDAKEGEPVIGSSGFSLGTQLLTLVSKNEFRLETFVGEREVGRLKIGQVARVEFPSAPNLVVSGKISKIGATASRSDRGAIFPLTILFNSEDERVRLGGSARFSITLDSKERCLSVPVGCVGVDEKGAWLVGRTDGGPLKKYVELGLSDGVFVEIVSGVSDRESVEVIQ